MNPGGSQDVPSGEGAMVIYQHSAATRYTVNTQIIIIKQWRQVEPKLNMPLGCDGSVNNMHPFFRSGNQRGEKSKHSKKRKKHSDRRKKKKSGRDKDRSDSSVVSLSSDTSESEVEVRKKRRKKTKGSGKRKQTKRVSSSSPTESGTGASDSESSTSSSSGASGSEAAKQRRREKRRKKRRKHRDMVWELLADAWPIEERPLLLRRKKGIGNRTLDELLRYKSTLEKEKEKRNLGQEVCSRDMKPQKVYYKAQSDDSVKKFHLSRFERQPLTHPKNYFHLIPKKREVVVRNFPMDHLGITGQVSEEVIGKMHNRSVKVSLDMFAKYTHKEARGSSKAGKYPNAQQIREGLINYCLMLLSLWPHDYAGLVVFKVLNEVNFGEDATSDAKKRAELVAELFNTVLSDNCTKAANQNYPLIYEQVNALEGRSCPIC